MHLTLRQTGSDFITNKEAPSSNTSIPNKRDAGDFMLSTSLWEVLINSPIEEKSHVSFAKKKGINWTCSQYLRNKRLLQQRKQLLLHPMKEAEETQGRKGERLSSILMTSQSRKTWRKSSISRFAHWGNQVETL